MKFKPLHIVLLVVLVALLVQGIHLAINKYQYLKSLEQQVETLKEQVAEKDEAEKTTITQASTNTQKAKATSQSIDDKLKADENTIDNRPVSDDELVEFLARFED